VPVARTVPGAFLDLVLGAVETDFAPPELMALLKHPLALLGRRAEVMRTAVRALERGTFRDLYLGKGLDGARASLEAARTEKRHRLLRLSEAEHEAALSVVDDLKTAFQPLSALYASFLPHSATQLAEAHAAVAEALAYDAKGFAGLWQGDAGEALSVLLAELIDAGHGLSLAAADYAPFYRSLVAGEVVRPRAALHPRLFIWGPLEARLQQADLVILGSLNDGVWPRHPEAGPWLSRPMRDTLGLPPPEDFVGRSAHDFAQALGAREVYLTRALKVDGVPTVPSRWLQRLEAIIRASGLEQKILPDQPWVAWAGERNRAPPFNPVQAPEPRPPVAARPRSLSVTRIERWIANPYEIFAKDILKLEPMNELGTEPDAPLRGLIVHRALHEFFGENPDKLPADIAAALIRVADRHFENLAGSPLVKAFWRPNFQRFAYWFAATEPGRRAGIARILTELEGALDLDGFSLTVRADRIDVTDDGSVVIYDYKTGKTPAQKHVDELFAPQLPLEAVIAAGGGFPSLGPRAVKDIRYINASGRDAGGEDRAAGKTPASALAAEALAQLRELVAQYSDPEMPYAVKRRSAPAFATHYRYDPYDHLARVKEWLTQEAEEDFG